MGYAVELYLDEPEAAEVRLLMERCGSTLPEIGAAPHVSLAVLEEADPHLLLGTVEAFFQEVAPLRIRFASIGVFPGDKNVVYLAPVVTAELLALHVKLHKRLASAGLSSHAYYLPGNWVPHCTVTFREDLPKALETVATIQQMWRSWESSLSTAHVVEFNPVVSLGSFRLSGGIPCRQ